MDKYYSGEKLVNHHKKGKGKLPLFCGNIERVITIYAILIARSTDPFLCKTPTPLNLIFLFLFNISSIKYEASKIPF